MDGDGADDPVRAEVTDEMADLPVDEALASNAKSLAVAVYQHHVDGTAASGVTEVDARARTAAGLYGAGDERRLAEADAFLGAAVAAAEDAAEAADRSEERDGTETSEREALVGAGNGEISKTYVLAGRVGRLADDRLDATRTTTVAEARDRLDDGALADGVERLPRWDERERDGPGRDGGPERGARATGSGDRSRR